MTYQPDRGPSPGLYFSEFLRDGNSRNLDKDGSVTPVVGSAGPPSGKIWYVHRLIIFSRDGATISLSNFLGLGNLTNGIALDYDSGGINYDLLNTQTLKRTEGFFQYMDYVQIQTLGTDGFYARWTFTEGGNALQLNNADGDTFNVTVNDDLTGLTRLRMIIQGYEVDE